MIGVILFFAACFFSYVWGAVDGYNEPYSADVPIAAMEACMVANSELRSFDRKKAICKNTAEIEYKVMKNEASE